jgi:hypothetical protein
MADAAMVKFTSGIQEYRKFFHHPIHPIFAKDNFNG